MTILYKDPVATFGKDYVLPLSWLRLFFYWHGSLMQRLLFEIILWLALAALVIALKLYVATWTHAFLLVLAILANVLSPILTFMLGFYTSTIYSRWWDARVSMCGTAQMAAYNVAMEMTQFIYSDKDPITAARLKQRIVRWCNLAFALVLREIITDGTHLYNSFDSLEQLGMMTAEERQRIEHDVDRVRFTLPLMWAGHTFTRLRDHEPNYGVTHWVHLQLSQQLASLRQGLGSMYVFVTVPVPLMYRQLVSAAVRIYILVVVLLAGNLQLLGATSSGTDSVNYSWTDMVYIVSVFFIYIGWLHVADELANPYRIAPDGLDFDDYLSSQRADHATMVDDNSIRLPTVDSINDEPLPGDPNWNCPFVWRDHAYEAVPGWNKYKEYIRTVKASRQDGHAKTYDFFQRVRQRLLSDEETFATDDTTAPTQTDWAQSIGLQGNTSLRGTTRCWTGPPERIRYYGF